MKVRVRLALQYGALFFVAGAVLLAVTYLLVRHNLGQRPGPVTIVFESGTQPVHEQLAQLPGPPDGPPLAVQALLQEEAEFEAATLRSLLTGDAVALGIVGLLAIAFGWLMAGRATSSGSSPTPSTPCWTGSTTPSTASGTSPPTPRMSCARR